MCAHTEVSQVQHFAISWTGELGTGPLFLSSHFLHQDVDCCAAFDLSVQQELQRGEEGQAVCPRGYDLAWVPSASSAQTLKCAVGVLTSQRLRSCCSTTIVVANSSPDEGKQYCIHLGGSDGIFLLLDRFPGADRKVAIGSAERRKRCSKESKRSCIASANHRHALICL